MKITNVTELLDKPPEPAQKKKGGRPRKVLTYLEAQKLPDGETRKLQAAILALMENGTCINVSQACRMLSLSPMAGHYWKRYDKDFSFAVALANEVAADTLELKIVAEGRDTATMSLLKGKRPEYRDNYKADLNNPRLMSLLEELRKTGREGMKKVPAPETKTEDKDGITRRNTENSKRNDGNSDGGGI